MKMHKVHISVVIATYNRAELLRECLYSLADQTFPPEYFEVIVINDGSTDNTSLILDKFERDYRTSFVRLDQSNKGVSAARNAGIASAKGDIVAFTDDDCILPPNWLKKMDDLWRNEGADVAGIGGPLNTITKNNTSFVGYFLRYIDEFNYIPVLTNWLIRPVHVSLLKGDETVPYLRTSNASFRKKYLDEVSGFDATFRTPGGEDPDLCYRLMKRGHRCSFAKDLVVNHHSRESMKAYFITLGNYVVGEVRKSRKSMYYPDTVARNYRFLVLQKIASLFLSIVTLPLAWVRLFSIRDIPLKNCIIFPLVVIASKLYALVVSFTAAYLRKGSNSLW
jgi:glycosyltransferase involved in cell wall biosynthesis